MRRIVFIANSMAGVTCATKTKRHLPESEINLIVPSSANETTTSDGPVAKRLMRERPNLEQVAAREIGVLDTHDVMPGFDAHEVTVSSSRGNLTIRYTDIVIEVPATVRIPRVLQNAQNVFGWPVSSFATDPEACDNALLQAAAANLPVVVVGSGIHAMDALFLAREAGAPVHWIHTATMGAPDCEPHMTLLFLKHVQPAITYTNVQDTPAEQLTCTLSDDKNMLRAITLPNGTEVAVGCCLWTTPLMARHPLLREDGVILDSFGRIEATEGAAASLKLSLLGNGAAFPPARLAKGAVHAPIYAGGSETAMTTATAVAEKLADTATAFPGLLGVCHATTQGMQVYRAGCTLAEAAQQKAEAEYAVTVLPGNAAGEGKIILALIVHKTSQTIIGVQLFGIQTEQNAVEGIFGMALAAMAEGTPLSVLIQREMAGIAGQLLARAAGIARNKLTRVMKGISPEEFLASRQAGAEFFTLDLRATPDWKERQLPDSYNIPFPQLKKRLQDEVPRFTPIVLVCANGNDAYNAACRLAGLGATELYVLDGGMELWPYF